MNIGKAKGICSKCEKTVYLKDFTILAQMCRRLQTDLRQGTTPRCPLDCTCKFKTNIFESCVKCEEKHQEWLNRMVVEGISRRELYEIT